MSGIGSYFHGETGIVLARKWLFSEESMTDVLLLDRNPHRAQALDYGSDIGIDPRIAAGDEVVYLRLSSTTGMWVRKQDEYTPGFNEALARPTYARSIGTTYERHLHTSRPLARKWARLVAGRHGIPAEFVREDDMTWLRKARADAPVSIFLSHSGRNALFADDFYRSLREEANAAVWYDRDCPGERLGHQEAIAAVLQAAIHETQVFVILLTRASVVSDWVEREIRWAAAKAAQNSAFHLIVVDVEGQRQRLDAELLPLAGHIVDCNGLSIGQIFEELFAAVYRRTGRQEWLGRQRALGWVPSRLDGALAGYTHLMTDGGIAVNLEWTAHRDGDPSWTLRYEADEVPRIARGSGPSEVVDPEIQPGDRIGSTHLGFPKPIWMRSDAEVTPADVVDAYHDKIHPQDRLNCFACSGRKMRAGSASGPSLTLERSIVIAEAVVIMLLLAGYGLWRGFDPGENQIELWPTSVLKTLAVVFSLSVVLFGIPELRESLDDLTYGDGDRWERFTRNFTSTPWRMVGYPVFFLFVVLAVSIVIVGGVLAVIALWIPAAANLLPYALVTIYALSVAAIAMPVRYSSLLHLCADIANERKVARM